MKRLDQQAPDTLGEFLPGDYVVAKLVDGEAKEPIEGAVVYVDQDRGLLGVLQDGTDRTQECLELGALKMDESNQTQGNLALRQRALSLISASVRHAEAEVVNAR